MKTKILRWGGVFLTALLFSSFIFSGCKNNSDSGTESEYNAYEETLKELPADKELSDDLIDIDESESDGIRINFTIPAEAEQFTVYINGIGQVYEEYGVTPGNEGEFFYPFVNNDKEYDVLINFAKENLDNGYSKTAISVAWNKFKVTAKGGKGEVLVTKKQAIDVDKYGNITITAPTFSNVAAIPNWKIRVSPVHGISWLNKNGPRMKWMGNCYIQNNDLGKRHNIYDLDSWWNIEDSVDFIACDPWVTYTDSKNKSWDYRWDTVAKESVNLPAKKDRPELPVYTSDFQGFVDEMPLTKEMNSGISVNSSESAGIRIDFTIPKVAERYVVIINGIGQIYECGTYDGLKPGSKDYFFYPFVNSNTTYTVLVYFSYENQEDGYVTGDTIVGWKIFEIRAKGGKGEVLVTKKPAISIDEGGDFTFTAPTFSNVAAIPGWYMRASAVHGTSWLNPSGQRRKWMSNCYVENNELNTVHNIYLEGDWWNDDDPIGFICYDPWVKYTDSKGKTWSYRWDGLVEDVNLPAKKDTWKTATMADLDKLKGTWKGYSEGIYGFGTNHYEFLEVLNSTLTITDEETKTENVAVISKEDNSAFTDAEKNVLNEYNVTFSSDGTKATEITTSIYPHNDSSNRIEAGKFKLFANGKFLDYYYQGDDDFHRIYTKQE